MKRTPPLPRPAILAAGLTLVLVLSTGADAYAAADVKNAGKNIADVLKTWSGVLFGGVTGIMAIYYLMARKIGPALGFAALAMVVGSFVFAPNLMGDLSENIAKTALK